MNRSVLRWVLGAALLAGVVLALSFRHRLDAGALEEWVWAAGLLAPLLFMALYAVATVLFLPGALLTLAGGALFGPVWGTLWNLTGATLGAGLAFLTARYLGADWVERRAGGHVKRLVDGVAAEGWRFVAFVRLVPLFPFNLLNYALGLTPIRFVPYLLATWVFMLPGAIAYTYLGYAGREAVAGGEDLIQKGLVALGLLAVVVFLPRLVRRLRERPVSEAEATKRDLDEDVEYR
ncbi:MAG: TVP38/TMEM64 family protein [Gammaproteobacteria bacterium]|nr:MAG: TVP38/TMEM64 family protein [Gammaproteobacteria bacterium]